MNRIFTILLLCSSAFAWAPQQSPFMKTTSLHMSDSDEVVKGTVKWFDNTKGFGFIVPSDGSDDIFVHQTAIQTEGFRSLADGEDVEFRVEVDNTGRRKASFVTGPDGSDVQGKPFPAGNDDDFY